MEQNQQQFKCSGNCLNCLPAQRGYCASQHAYSNMKVLDSMMDILIGMKDDVRTLSEKIQAMQDNEALLFDPLTKDEEAEVLPPTFQQRTTIAQ